MHGSTENYTHASCRLASHQMKFLTLDPVPCLHFTCCHGLRFYASSVPEVPIKQFHICVWCLRGGTLATIIMGYAKSASPTELCGVWHWFTHKNYFNTVASTISDS